MFKCLGWPCPATFILLLFETPILTLCLLAPRNMWCGNACFGAQVSSKYGTWYSARVILQFMCVGCWAGVTYLRYTVLTSPKKGETAVHCCDPTLSVLVMLVSRNVFHVVSALQSIVCLHKLKWHLSWEDTIDVYCKYLLPRRFLFCGCCRRYNLVKAVSATVISRIFGIWKVLLF